MDTNARIAQFENMAQADPDNEMAHYSLAGAYMQANRFAEAADSYLRCVALAPGMSKAYQLAGEAFIKAGATEKAAQVLAQGYGVAAERGDMMPRNAIGELLKSLGKPVPEVAGGGGARPSATVSLGRGGKETPLAKAPFKGRLGDWIFKNVSEEKWNAWIGQGTKVINELRLDLSQERDSEVYDQHMREFLGIDEEMYGKILEGKAP
jgi:Fe-S cluster biosynthesis and repair protein YggX